MMQEGHGGWNDQMAEVRAHYCCSSLAKIVSASILTSSYIKSLCLPFVFSLMLTVYSFNPHRMCSLLIVYVCVCVNFVCCGQYE